MRGRHCPPWADVKVLVRLPAPDGRLAVLEVVELLEATTILLAVRVRGRGGGRTRMKLQWAEFEALFTACEIHARHYPGTGRAQ